MQMLIEKILPFVKELLNTYGEFFPVAAAIKADGSIATIGLYEENDRQRNN